MKRNKQAKLCVTPITAYFKPVASPSKPLSSSTPARTTLSPPTASKSPTKKTECLSPSRRRCNELDCVDLTKLKMVTPSPKKLCLIDLTESPVMVYPAVIVIEPSPCPASNSYQQPPNTRSPPPSQDLESPAEPLVQGTQKAKQPSLEEASLEAASSDERTAPLVPAVDETAPPVAPDAHVLSAASREAGTDGSSSEEETGDTEALLPSPSGETEAVIDVPPPVTEAVIDVPPPVTEAVIDAPPPVTEAVIDVPPSVTESAPSSAPVVPTSEAGCGTVMQTSSAMKMCGDGGVTSSLAEIDTALRLRGLANVIRDPGSRVRLFTPTQQSIVMNLTELASRSLSTKVHSLMDYLTLSISPLTMPGARVLSGLWAIIIDPHVASNQLCPDVLKESVTWFNRVLTLHPPGQSALVDNQYREFMWYLNEGPFGAWEVISSLCSGPPYHTHLLSFLVDLLLLDARAAISANRLSEALFVSVFWLSREECHLSSPIRKLIDTLALLLQKFNNSSIQLSKLDNLMCLLHLVALRCHDLTTELLLVCRKLSLENLSLFISFVRPLSLHDRLVDDIQVLKDMHTAIVQLVKDCSEQNQALVRQAIEKTLLTQAVKKKTTADEKSMEEQTRKKAAVSKVTVKEPEASVTRPSKKTTNSAPSTEVRMFRKISNTPAKPTGSMKTSKVISKPDPLTMNRISTRARTASSKTRQRVQPNPQPRCPVTRAAAKKATRKVGGCENCRNGRCARCRQRKTAAVRRPWK